MPATVLAALKLIFLLFLYLFLARVVRAVWVEIFAERQTVAEEVPAGAVQIDGSDKRQGQPLSPTPGPESRKERKASARNREKALTLKIVEPPEERGQIFPVTDEMTIGRAAGCAIAINDTFASQLHARVFRREGTVYVEDLGSTNGTFLNRKQVHGPVPLAIADRIRVGDTVLELIS